MGLVRRQSQAGDTTPAAAEPDDLLALVADGDADRRREAALGLDGRADAVPVLVQRLAVETEPAVRDAVLTTLAAHDTPAVAAALAAHLSSDDAGLRTAIAEALATMRNSAPAVTPALSTHPDHDVRIMAAMVLADLPHSRAQDWLVEMIDTDPHPNVVAAAIDALLPSAGPDHAALLGRARDRFPDDPFLRFTIDAVLPRLAGEPR